MDTVTQDARQGDLRVSDADRDRAVSELSEHFRAGRLTMEELDARTGQALQARTAGELGGLFTDLPRGDVAVTATPATAVPTTAVPTTAVPTTAVPTTAVPSSSRGCAGLSIGRIALIALVVTAVSSAVSGAVTGHHAVGALVPVIIIALVFSRTAIRRGSS